MNLKYKSSLQRTMIVYFILIGFASVLVGIEFIMDTNDKELKNELLHNFERFSKQEISLDQAFSPIHKLRNKAILMIAIVMVVVAIVLTMFIKNITEPLQHMIEVSRKISEGDLSQTIRIHSDNELSELGNVINELTSNLQEVILLSDAVCSSGVKLISEISEALKEQPSQTEEIRKITRKAQQLNKEFRLLGDIVQDFKLYRVKIKS